MDPLPHVRAGPSALRLAVGGLVLLITLPATYGLYFFGVAATLGCFGDCSAPEPRPVLGVAMVLASAGMAGTGAGLVPWAFGRPQLIPRVIAVVAGLVLLAFALAVLGR